MARGARTIVLLLGGRRPSATRRLRSLRWRAPEAGLLAVGGAEVLAGLLLASGLLTSLAALALAVILLGSIRIGDARDVFLNPGAGLEVALAAWATAIAVAAMGPGRFSLDAAIGWADALSGLGWGIAVLLAPPLVSAGRETLGRLAERPAVAPPQAEKARVEPVPRHAGRRSNASQSESARLFGRPARPPRAVGLGIVQPPAQPSRRTPSVEIQLADADDATDLIDCLWRHGLGGRLVESGSRWAVEVESPHAPSQRLLTDVIETLEIWLLQSGRPGLLVRVDDAGPGGRARSGPTDGVPW